MYVRARKRNDDAILRDNNEDVDAALVRKMSHTKPEARIVMRFSGSTADFEWSEARGGSEFNNEA